MKQKQSLAIESEDMTDLKEGDILHTIEFLKIENEDPRFDIQGFKFIKYLKKDNHIEGLEINKDSIVAELQKAAGSSKVAIKTDISTGFYKDPKVGVDEFINNLEEIIKATKIAYNKMYNKK